MLHSFLNKNDDNGKPGKNVLLFAAINNLLQSTPPSFTNQAVKACLVIAAVPVAWELTPVADIPTVKLGTGNKDGEIRTLTFGEIKQVAEMYAEMQRLNVAIMAIVTPINVTVAEKESGFSLPDEMIVKPEPAAEPVVAPVAEPVKVNGK